MNKELKQLAIVLTITSTGFGFITGYILGRSDSNITTPLEPPLEIFYPSYSPMDEAAGWHIIHLADHEAMKHPTEAGRWDINTKHGGVIKSFDKDHPLTERPVNLQWRKLREAVK